MKKDEDALRKIAAIAHFGGLSDMSGLEALIAIRRVIPKEYFIQIANKSDSEIKKLINKKPA